LAAGKKLVGISQRRNRQGALFHTSCPLDPPGEVLLALLELDQESRSDLARILEHGATCLRECLPAEMLAEALGRATVIGRVVDHVVASIDDAGR
jgi:lipoate-protein ligase A